MAKRGASPTTGVAMWWRLLLAYVVGVAISVAIQYALGISGAQAVLTSGVAMLFVIVGIRRSAAPKGRPPGHT